MNEQKDVVKNMSDMLMTMGFCKDCKYWDEDWFRRPQDDAKGIGWRFCNHPGFVGEIKPLAVTCTESSCRGFEEKDK